MIAAGDVYFRHIEFFPRAEESTTLENFPLPLIYLHTARARSTCFYGASVRY